MGRLFNHRKRMYSMVTRESIRYVLQKKMWKKAGILIIVSFEGTEVTYMRQDFNQIYPCFSVAPLSINRREASFSSDCHPSGCKEIIIGCSAAFTIYSHSTRSRQFLILCEKKVPSVP